MSSYPPREDLKPLGALCLDYTDDIHRPPGDPLNELSYHFPVIHEQVKQGTLWNIVNSNAFSDEFLQNFIHACQKLEERGAIGIITSCGFLAQVQNRLAEKINIPIATSSLMQIPFVLSIISPKKRVGVLTFDGEVLGETHFRGIGISDEMAKRVTVQGCHDDGALRRIIRDGDPYIHAELESELVDLAKELLEKDPSIGAIVLECTQMPPFAKAIQEKTGLPVYDAITMIDWFYSGLRARNLPKDDFTEEGLRRRKRSDKELKKS
ncbi:hypothetical protein BVG19_g248 [[Candida] boidinii]|nr:hypothetical protein BVG19_g248 [[Candida] boidinii]OWB49767.1 hypothetical protein B5S27_g1311 [[Candida] boidinii]OWB68165.1 hypothetical protein B5S30_g3539 [[Candida] boidinii]